MRGSHDQYTNTVGGMYQTELYGVSDISSNFFSDGNIFDQICNTARLQAGGSAESLDKFAFTSSELCEKIQLIIEDTDGNYARNCERLRYIAHIASRRKSLGADLIEEVLYDNGFRVAQGNRIAPHAVTADMRMPSYKAKNWDLMAVAALCTGLFAGGPSCADEARSPSWGCRLFCLLQKKVAESVSSIALPRDGYIGVQNYQISPALLLKPSLRYC